jgi:hypothetical protein
VEEEDGMHGGSESDIRSLFYWTRTAYRTLSVSGGLWVVWGGWKLIQGFTWIERDRLLGSTQATSDIVTGIALFVVAFATFLLARLLYLDVYQIFAQRRYQVPREKLLVYGILGLPFGFVISGLLLLVVNIKLSHPDFLPSHAEAYPDAMAGYVQVPKAMMATELPVSAYDGPVLPEDAPTDLAPLGFDDIPVSAEEAQPAPEFFGDSPAPAGPYTPLPEVVAEPAPVAAITEAYVEDVPEEEIAEVVAEVAPPVAAQYEEVEAVVEDAPVEAVVEAVVEDVSEEEGGIEMMEEAPSDEPEGPPTIEEAHEDLLDKLLGK